MFGELPKLFGRNFAMGYFLPTVVFIVVSLEYLLSPVLFPELLPMLQADLLVGVTVIGLISWLVGVCLLVTNREILRLFEGYGRFNPAALLLSTQKKRFRKLHEDISKLNKEYRACQAEGRELPRARKKQRGKFMREAAERYPDAEHWVLATSFGNIIRAFEVYPRVMYGLESIQGWNRLTAILPEDYRKLVDNAKAQVDFGVNIALLSGVFVFGYLAIAIYTAQIVAPWIVVLVAAIAWMAYSRAKGCALEWGELVKASFDTFLPELYAKLGLPQSDTRDHERQILTGFSQSIIYRSPSSMADRNQSKPNSAPHAAQLLLIPLLVILIVLNMAEKLRGK